MVASEDTDSAG
jgi:hypothetical protein